MNNILVIIRPEVFSILLMLFLITYDRYCSRFREQKNMFLPFALVCLAHCVMALITEITVNTDGISPAVNDICHVLFFLFSLLYSLLFLQYAMSVILPKGKASRVVMAVAGAISLGCIIVMLCSPIEYLQGRGTDYSAGLGPTLCYALGFLFFITADIMMVIFRKRLDRVVLATTIPLSCIALGLLVVQILIPEFLFTAPALSITAVGIFFAIENPVNRLRKKAFLDAYLDVWNRNGYEYDLQHIIAEKVKEEENLIYMIGDVNGLKAVNDNVGHEGGDRLLKTVAECLLECMPSAYKVYRVGGDEFAALFFDVSAETVKAETDAAAAACAEFKPAPNIPTGISVGYACLEKGDTIEDVVRRADAMMYESKRRFYETSGYDRRRR